MTGPNPYEPPIVTPIAESVGFGRGSLILIATPIACLVFGAAVGVISRMARNDVSEFHVEAVVELGVKILANLVVLTVCLLIPKVWMRVLNYSLSTAMLWMTSTILWTIINGGMLEGHLAVNGASLIIAMFIGTTVFFAIYLCGEYRRRKFQSYQR